MFRSIKAFIILLSALYFIAPAQDNSDRMINGGLQYTAWSEQDSEIRCCLIRIAQIGRGRAKFIEEGKDFRSNICSDIEQFVGKVVTNVTVEVILPPGCSFGTVQGGTLKNNKILVGDLKQGSLQFVIFSIKNRPTRNRNIIVAVDYIKMPYMTTAKTRCYIDLSLGEGRPVYNSEVASLLIVFDTQGKLAGTIDVISDKNRPNRLEYAYQFKQTILKIEEENNSLQSGLLNSAIFNYKTMMEYLQNAAIEPNLVIKRIRYFLAKDFQTLTL
jgi:hypothetical protein